MQRRWKVEEKSHSRLRRGTHNQTAHLLPDIKQGSQVVLQNPTTRLWDAYAVVVSVDPHCKYRVKTKDGRVLVRNLRCWVPTLYPPGWTPQHIQMSYQHHQEGSFQDNPAGLVGSHKGWWKTLHGTNKNF